MNTWLSEFGTSFSGQRILVTGASGFIGSHLCDALLALGAEVYTLSRSANPPLGCKNLFIDLNDLDALRGVVVQSRPHIVYHLAAQVTAQQSISLVLPTLHNNLVGTVNLFLAFAESDVQQVITVGSSEVSHLTPSFSPYAVSKAGVDLYADLFQRNYGLPIVKIRLFMAYGPRQKPNKLVPYVVRSCLLGQPPYIQSGERVCDFIYIVDVVRGLLAAGMQKNLNGYSLDLGTGESISIKDLTAMISSSTGGLVEPVFSEVSDRVMEKPQFADLALTKKLLNWNPMFSLEEGLKNTVLWFRSNLNTGKTNAN